MKGKHQLNNASVMSALAFMVDFIHLSVCVESILSSVLLNILNYKQRGVLC
jgi:riboflavin transporter FmnP